MGDARYCGCRSGCLSHPPLNQSRWGESDRRRLPTLDALDDRRLHRRHHRRAHRYLYSSQHRWRAEKPDERDRAIERLGVQVGQAFLIIGGLSALLMALAEWEWFWIANVLYFGFALSGILEGISKVTAYRRGVPW